MSRITKAEIADAVEAILIMSPEGRATIAQLIAEISETLSAAAPAHFLYVVTEFIDGQTLTQWMIENPKAGLETVRGIAEQIAKGLRAFHRMEMLHQDIRPDNIMIDTTGTVKIIDFGSTRMAGVAEAAPSGNRYDILGTEQYTAPEYFLGEPASSRSDLFSLGVITYQMLMGKLPYGAQLGRLRRSPWIRAAGRFQWDS